VATDLASAELIKYAANAFLALKISFINEIGNLAERVGADVREVARGIGLDTRIGPRFLQAGLGWGGSCFGKDTAALIATAGEYGLAMPIVSAARDVNKRQRVRVVEKLLGELKILKGRRIALLGLAFKPDTDDLREAPAIDIARRLVQHGATVVAHDPVAADAFTKEHGELEVLIAATPEAAVEDADAVILVTEWAEYLKLDWAELGGKMRTKVVIDGRSSIDRSVMERAGFRFLTVP
jgi:UDPglucose 6-dehydrogenase